MQPLGEQPVAAVNLRKFQALGADVQRHPLPRPCLGHRLVLGMQPAYPHRLSSLAQEQSVTQLHLAIERGPGDHNTGTGHRESAVDGQAKTAAAAARADLTLGIDQGLAQGIDALAGDAGQRELPSAGIGPGLQQATDLRLDLADPTRLDAIALADSHQQPGDTQQLNNRQVFAGLRHHPVIRGHHQHHQIDTLGTGQHVVDKPLVARYVDETGQRCPRLQAGIAIAQVDGHAPFALFPALIPRLAGQRFKQGGLAMVDVPCRADDHLIVSSNCNCVNCASQPASSSSCRKSSHRASSSMRPSTGTGSLRSASSRLRRLRPRRRLDN
ncbi:hypothetical protein D3C77_437010 [compost metagenome]